MHPAPHVGGYILVFIYIITGFSESARAGTLNGSVTMLSSNSVADLTSEGALDWVHWGTHTEFGWDRKLTATPMIGPLVSLVQPGNGPFQFSDNLTGFSWMDGSPDLTVTNTTTGVWALGRNNGFQLTVPADTVRRRLRVYVGAFAAQGQFDASLSDGSALPYSDSSVNNQSNAPGVVYTLDFAADTNGQMLTVTYVVGRAYDSNVGNVTWQAATLANVDLNNPPLVTLIEPANNAVISAGTDISISAIAGDSDGTISRVQFYQGATKLGEAMNAPYGIVWSNAPPGNFLLSAVAIDDGGLSTTSSITEIFISTNGSAISGSVTTVPASVDLSGSDLPDWGHWGLSSSTAFDHKTGAEPSVLTALLLGSNSPAQMNDYPAVFNWTNGTPTGSAITSSGVSVAGLANGFELNVPALTSTQTLALYVGLYASRGTLQAWLSDFSTPAYVDSSLNSFYDNGSGVYLLRFCSPSSNTTLRVRYKSSAQYDMTYGGSVWLAAATLASALSQTPPPAAAPVLACAVQEGLFTVSFGTEAGRTYTVESADSAAPAVWREVTNFLSDGGTAFITDSAPAADARFFRVKTQ